MHMQGEPRTMQNRPCVYSDVTAEVRTFFAERLAVAVAAGIPPNAWHSIRESGSVKRRPTI